jgi:hypothetical protein
MSWLVATARQQVILKLIENEDVDPRQSHRYLRMANKTYLCLVYGNLKDKGFEAYLPCYRETFYKGRHKYWEPEPLFGRYIFVHFDERWPDVREVPGICNVLKPREDMRRPKEELHGKLAPIEQPQRTKLRHAEILKREQSPLLPFLIEDKEIAEWKLKERDGFFVGFQEGQPVRARNGIFN